MNGSFRPETIGLPHTVKTVRVRGPTRKANGRRVDRARRTIYETFHRFRSFKLLLFAARAPIKPTTRIACVESWFSPPGPILDGAEPFYTGPRVLQARHAAVSIASHRVHRGFLHVMKIGWPLLAPFSGWRRMGNANQQQPCARCTSFAPRADHRCDHPDGFVLQ